MSYFEVTAAQLRNRAEELRGLNSRFGSEVESLSSTEENLKAMWEGEANTMFHNAFARDKGQMDNFKAAIERYIEALLIIAAKYEEAEARNVSTAQTRSY